MTPIYATDSLRMLRRIYQRTLSKIPLNALEMSHLKKALNVNRELEMRAAMLGAYPDHSLLPNEILEEAMAMNQE